MKKRRVRKTRGRNLTDHDIQAIVETLDAWSGPLSWSLLIKAVEKRLDSRYTRQALHRYDRITHAFRLRKDALREQQGKPGILTSVEEQVAQKVIEDLKAKVTRLEAENQRLLDQFAVWAYNAWIRGINEAILNEPLPSIIPDGLQTLGNNRNL